MYSSNLYYRMTGKGDPVVFLHGFMEDSLMWESLLNYFPNKKLIFIDLPGHGKSNSTKNFPWTMKSCALEIENICSYLQLKHPLFIGHSMGGYVLLELAKIVKDGHFILYHSHPWEDTFEKKQDRRRIASFVHEKQAFFVQEAVPNLFLPELRKNAKMQIYVERALQLDPSGISNASIAMSKRLDQSYLMQSQNQRFTVIQGKYDSLIPYEKMAAFCQENSVGYFELPNAGHMSQVESPEDLSMIFEFLLNEKNFKGKYQ